jgi:glycosyltransferase involved in cell wall biosynthesis
VRTRSNYSLLTMKVIHVVSGMDPSAGGISQAVRTMIEGLTKKGIESEVICIGPAIPGEQSNDPFRMYFTGPGRSSWQFNQQLRNWLKNNLMNYDVIIVHGLWQFHTFAVYEAASAMRQNSPKIYVMPHGMLDPWFQKAKGRKLKAIRNWIIWKVFEHRIVNMADGLLFTCETEKQLARETFSPYRPKSEFVVGLGVRSPPDEIVEAMYAAQPFIQDTPGYLLFLGRIDVKKGVDLLVDAYLSLKSNGYDLPALVIAGPGLDTKFGIMIRQKAAQDKHIHFPGMLSGSSKWATFYGCEAFVLPSHQENFGIAVVEALACGRPVLISDQVNIWREIEEGGGGIVEEDTLPGTINMLAKWAKLPAAKKAEMSRKARQVYLQHYSVDQSAEKLSEVLSRLEKPVLIETQQD